ncbi:MAG TPA: hypothetical protein VFT31_12455 [Kribbella sp.]|nr:hypothetical protein [Kribbella sp.]
MYDDEMRAAARAAIASGESLACDDKYPRLIDEAAAAIASLHPSRPVHRVQAAGCTAVVSYWRHWPCLFPQHGPGPKHQRRIVLDDWQRAIVSSIRKRSCAA